MGFRVPGSLKGSRTRLPDGLGFRDLGFRISRFRVLRELLGFKVVWLLH